MFVPLLQPSKIVVMIWTMDTQEILPEAVVETVGKIHLRGAEQYKAFIEERLLKNDIPISSTIARNSFALLSRRNTVVQSKDNEKIAELKSNCSFFSKLYIANQAREGNLEEFFKHENQKSPPSLAEGGCLLDRLESYCMLNEGSAASPLNCSESSWWCSSGTLPAFTWISNFWRKCHRRFRTVGHFGTRTIV